MKPVVTILAILIGIAVIWGVMVDSRRTNAPQDNADKTAAVTEDTASDVAVDIDAPATALKADATPPASDTPETNEQPATSDGVAAVDTSEAAAPAATPAVTPAASTQPPIPGLHAVEVATGREAVLGYDDPKSPFKLRVEINRYGAAVNTITLGDYLKTVGKPDHYIVHEKLALPDPADPKNLSKYQTFWLAYAAKAVTVNGTRIPLETNDAWSAGELISNDQSASITYTATIADGNDQPVLKIERTYGVTVDSYELSLDQKLTNLTDQPLSVAWEQNLQGDLVNDSGYLGDRRQFVAGYFALWWDTQREGIYTKDADQTRTKIVNANEPSVWPVRGLNPGAELAWLASLNRYFAVVTHAEIDESLSVTAKVPPLQTIFPHIDQSIESRTLIPGTAKDHEKVMVLKAATNTLTLAPNQPLDLNLDIFAGPRQPELFGTPPYSTLHLDQTIVYSLGGACSFCTFQWLAHGLLWLLKLFEGQILILGGVGIGVHDWGLAIILLVLVVRLILHPLTKRAQINMMKMGKMMQAIQPEVEKLKKKYKNDQQKINAEMMKLYREKGVNPANIFGCLPMFLQTPIWIALYAMLYYAIELRHEPAFWGFFQWISNDSWRFLADLSQADNFIRIAEEPFKLNLYFIHPEFQSINILPLLMAVVFYFQQKITSPPPANEQQAQQQKMMKFVIFLFPIFLYSAPSGLTLYILASTAAGIVDSTIVRRHIKEQEASGELFKTKPVKEGGFRDRIAKAVEAKQQQLAQQQNQHKGGKPRKRK